VYGREGFMRVCTLALSVIAHLLVLALVVVIPLFATDVLPEPHRVIEFVEVTPVVVPPPPPILRTRKQPQPDTAPSNVAPREEPQGIAPEPEPAITEPFDVPPSLVDGVAFGDDSLVRDPVPPPPPRDEERVRVGGAIARPERIHYVPPIYPAIARAASIEGTVILEAVIGTDGSVQELRVLRPVPFLSDAALEAVRQWLFTPTRLNGEPVPVVMTVTVTFTWR
jgi:protein TonB